MSEQRLTDLEIKLTFLEETVDQLNGVIIDQNRRIDQLQSQLAGLKNEIEESKTAAPSNEPPPHY